MAIEPSPVNGPARRRSAEAIVTGIALILAGWFYVWTATSGEDRLSLALTKHDLYNRLVDGFLAGRLGFLEEPPLELHTLAYPYDPAQNAPYRKFHDVAYYKGRYYLYFGPAPAVVLLAPWKLLTGTYLPQHIAVAVFAWGAALLGVFLLRGLHRKYFPEVPSWILLGCNLAVLFGSLLPVLLRRPVYYELAIASGCFFSMLGLVLIERAVRGGAFRNRWLMGASLAFGFAVASRPNLVFAGAGALAWVLWPQVKPLVTAGRRDWAALLPILTPAFAPMGAVILALLAYNQARFGSPTEFGTYYQLAGGNQQTTAMMSANYLLPNLWYYLFAPAQFSLYFPFIQVTGFLPFTTPAGYTGQENMYGLLVTLPFLWAAVWLWRSSRRNPGLMPESLRQFAASAGILAGVAGAFLLLMSGANNRYFLDFVPVLAVVAGIGVLTWDASRQGWSRVAGRVLWGTALVATLFFNVFVSLQHNELMRHHNPEGYRKLAYAFNYFSHWTKGDDAGQAGPIKIRLEFPRERTGRLEPLVVTGLAFRADFIYVFYQDDKSIVLGFEHTSYGGPKTPPLRIDYAAEHVLEIDMGALYPPIEHPYYDGWSPDEITARKRCFEVRLNGRPVLSGEYECYDSSPGDVTVGRNPVSEAFGRRFTGRIIGVERLPAVR
jgi:hypothetical protein